MWACAIQCETHMSTKKNVIQSGFRFHRLLWWSAGLALLIFVVSGFLHVLMTWTGPQTAVQRPPQQAFTTEQMRAVMPLLQQQGIQNAGIVKLVPSEQGAVLQVTTDAQQPRRYFDVVQGVELNDFDEAQARWLAQYYLNDSERNIEEVRFQTAFDNEYPWVNRLLPVYRIRFAGDDNLTLYIHTETLALASISNDWKSRVQWVFRQLHTFSWLEEFRHGRVVLMALLLCSLLGMVISGLALLMLFKRASNVPLSRRLHRVVAYVAALPLLGFSVSGFYHLLFNEYVAAAPDFNIAQPLKLPPDMPFKTAMKNLPQQELHGVNVLRIADELYFRASVAKPTSTGGGEHDHHAIRQQRFDGIAREQGSVYQSLSGTHIPQMTDELAAQQLAMDHLGLSASQIKSVEKITHFGPGYDFRNKRLPVWKVQVDAAPWDVLYVDVASGVLVDRSSASSRLENLSFSFLHKWNFLVMPLGRENRDVLLAVVLGLIVSLAGLGVWIRLMRRR